MPDELAFRGVAVLSTSADHSSAIVVVAIADHHGQAFDLDDCVSLTAEIPTDLAATLATRVSQEYSLPLLPWSAAATRQAKGSFCPTTE